MRVGVIVQTGICYTPTILITRETKIFVYFILEMFCTIRVVRRGCVRWLHYPGSFLVHCLVID